VYLFARDKSLFWRVVYVAAILFLPVMMIKIGSRGGLVALAFTLLSPLLFVRQVLRRPMLAALLLVTVLLASASVAFLIKQRGVESSVAARLTDVQRAKTALEFRMEPIRKAVEAVAERPAGSGYYSWFERTGSQIWPHNDFFFALGVYGIPGATLFAVFAVLLMLTVKRMPLTLEKLYARAVLTFLLVMGLNIKQLSAKYYWVFLAFVLAAERLSFWRAEEQGNLPEEMDEKLAYPDD
jgi:O-antigen ligase